MKKYHKNKGFTLIELLVVIAVIGVLSGVVMQSLNSARTKSRNAVRLENADTITKAFQLAITGANNNQLPSSGGNLVCLGTPGTCWTGYPVAPAAVNTVLSSGLAGGKIPLDSFFQTGTQGDAFLYNSNIPSATPPGAYIYWRMEEGFGASCGRGTQYALPAPPFLCMLHLGPGTP